MDTKQIFDQCATDYDRDRPTLVPDFHQFYDVALKLIPYIPSQSFHILDLGAGTGLFSAMVAALFPNASFHLTDISQPMLDQAQARFNSDPRFTFSQQHHLQLDAVERYDLVISALSIHHLDHAEKQSLFSKIHTALMPAGMFINADQALAPNPSAENHYDQMWLEDVTANNVAPQTLNLAKQRIQFDKNATLIDQLNWLQVAGFTNIDCAYKRFRFIVYHATKGNP